MKDKEMIQALIKGSNRINEMREEIKLVFNLIASSVTRANVPEQFFNQGRITVKEGECEWKVYFREGNPGVLLIIRCEAGETHDACYFSNQDKKELLGLSMANVHTVHDGLCSLLKKVEEYFPLLKSKVNVLLENAD